jgi:hypothetical protein
MRLSYWGTNTYNPPFTIGEVPWSWAPMLDQNITSTTITPSALTGSSITLTASSGIFKSTHVGSYWQINHKNPTQYITQNLNANATSSSIKVLGKWSLQTFGIWTADLALQQSDDNGTNWSTIRTYKSRDDYNAVSTGESTKQCLLRMVVSGTSSVPTSATLTISGTTATLSGSGYSAGAGDQITVVSSDSTQSANKALGIFTLRTGNSTTLTYQVPSGTTVPTGTITFSYGAPRAMLSPLDPTLKGFVRVTGYTSATSVTAKVIADLGDTTATSNWSEGAFSAVRGYPTSCALHESRVIFAGTSDSPTTIWGSYTSDFENFKQGAYDSDSYSFTLSSSSGGLIKWIVSKTALLIGTTQEEWSLSSSDGTRPLTPTNVIAKKQSRYGSGGLPALILNDTVVYLQKMGRKLREFVYAWNSETWVSNDITALAEHTTRGGIVELAYQRVPDALLWMVRADGQLVSMTYEREQQVVGFSRHTTDGTFESVATVNGLGKEDEVYVLVNRTINGSTARYIERFKTGMRDALDTADTSNWWYLDCAKRLLLNSPSTTITGLSHLEGKIVSVWADQAVGSTIVYQPTVVNGSITLQSPALNVLVGIPFVSMLVPQPLVRDMQDGTSAGRRMKINKMNVKVYQSLAGEYSTDGTNWFPLVSRHLSDDMDALPPVIMGYERVTVASNWKDGVDIFIAQTLPMPLTIAAIVASWDSSEASQ